MIRLKIVVIDDGSTDKTVEVAKMNGVKHLSVISRTRV